MSDSKEIYISFHERSFTIFDVNNPQVSHQVAAAWGDGMFHFFLNVVPVGNVSYKANGKSVSSSSWVNLF
jgi:hypothetical protein